MGVTGTAVSTGQGSPWSVTQGLNTLQQFKTKLVLLI